jgi:ATP-dependent helicase/DNAse subunit B
LLTLVLMLLVTGAAGSGKTSLVMEKLRAALVRGDGSVRLLAPTATMARHIRNRVAREGFVPRPRLIQTLSTFVEPWAADLPQVSDAHLYLIVEAAARRVNRQEFARVAHMPGFCASLARTIEELSSAGCDSARLAHSLPRTPLAEAFQAVYAETDRELARRGLAMRSTRLARVAERIHADGMPGISAVWLDGFHALSDPELAVVEAMGRHTEIIVTLPAAAPTEPTRARLVDLGFSEQRLERRRAEPQVDVVEAPAIEREVDEIAARILDEAASGRPFREIGVILRSADVYEPILRATLERFGIPARYYLDAELATHGVTRYLTGIVDGLLAGWPPAALLAALRLDPKLGNSQPMDEFARTGRCTWQPLNEKIGQLRALEAWRNQKLAPEEWARRLRSLRALFEPPRPTEPAVHAMVELWRSQAAVLTAFAEAVDEAAAWFAASRVLPLGEFWRAVKAILRLSPLRSADERRNVVNVLSAYEARQWELPVVFVCGLVEKQFPRYSPQDAFFPDAARRELQAAGIRVRTTADAELEEEFLFDSAVTRATATLTLSYPKSDGRGEQNLRSTFLERYPQPARTSRVVAPFTSPALVPHVPAGTIAAADLRDAVAHQHQVMRVTAIENYAQCPFQFFGRHTLKLDEPAKRPEDRLDARVQGNIVHQVVAEWQRTPQPVVPLFERVFAEICRKEQVGSGYRTEALRTRMRADLERFVAKYGRPATADTRIEETFQFAVDESLQLRGRIDRMDIGADGRADVVDFKYSKRASELAKDQDRLQGPLYLLAVEKAFQRKAGSMFYCGLRDDVQLKEQTVTRERLAAAETTALRIASEVRAGHAEPHPADLEPCRYCTFKDVCRYQATAAELSAAEGA